LTQFPGGSFAAQKRPFVEARQLVKRAFDVRVLFYPSGNCDFCGDISAATGSAGANEFVDWSGARMKAVTLAERFELNNQIAQANRKEFDAVGLKVISVVGPAGSGKTSAIEALITHLDPKVRVAVMVGNLAAERQVARITRHGSQAVALITDNVTAVHVRESLTQVDLQHLDLLIIEADGNALSPVEFDLGHHLRVSVFSVAGGDDKATEYPFLVAGSDLVLLTKTDLLPFVTFDPQVFCEDVKRMKSDLNVIHASAQTNQGIKAWVGWVESHLTLEARNRRNARMFDPFVGMSDRAKS
jgi:hydrogenase nickel incorporation protein HypB